MFFPEYDGQLVRSETQRIFFGQINTIIDQSKENLRNVDFKRWVFLK